MNGFRRLVGLGLVLIAAGAAGCGDDESQGSGGGGTTSPGAGGGGTTTGTTTSSGTAGGGGAGAGGGGGGGGGSAECDALPAGPIDPVLVTDVFNGSEDLAFDGKGHIVAKQGNNIVMVDAAQQVTNLATLAQTAYGLRYRPDGFLVVARPGQNTVVEISPAGVVAPYAINLSGPNGVYPDLDGNVWVTEFGGDRVSRINPDKTVDPIVSGAPEVASPNGIVYDAARMALFYTNYSAGQIMRVDLAPGGNPAPVLVTSITDASLDGLVMDACGNIYVVDQGNSDLYRVRLDAGGAALGDAELLASFPTNVANAQFGSGQGFDPKTIYAAGVPGSVYAVAAGVAGAPVPIAP
jgi:sugar lactone lactonase YvrE